MLNLRPLRSSVVQAVTDIGLGVLDLLYPPRCLGCGARPESPTLPLCPRCLQSLERASPTEVGARLDRLPVGTGVFREARALWVFDKEGPLQALQHALKYRNRPQYGRPLGQLMGEAVVDECPTIDGTIPVPLHHTRWLERGYNQSHTIAEGVAEVLGCPCRSDLLDRPRPTRSQNGLTRKKRWRNVQGRSRRPQSETGDAGCS